MTEFESPQENGEQNNVQENKLLSTNFTVETQNRKVEGLKPYCLGQQIFKLKVNNGHNISEETSNSLF